MGPISSTTVQISSTNNTNNPPGEVPVLCRTAQHTLLDTVHHNFSSKVLKFSPKYKYFSQNTF